MPLFTESELRKSASKLFEVTRETAESILLKFRLASIFEEEFDIFLSHSYLDNEVILGLKEELENMGFSAYVDWIRDQDLDRTEASKETAERLRQRMKKCKSLLFATSVNSSYSKWMPWECGYFDGINGRVAICPIAATESSSYIYQGQEYLGLYPYIKKLSTPERQSLWIHESSRIYVRFEKWLQGEKPTEHL